MSLPLVKRIHMYAGLFTFTALVVYELSGLLAKPAWARTTFSRRSASKTVTVRTSVLATLRSCAERRRAAAPVALVE